MRAGKIWIGSFAARPLGMAVGLVLVVRLAAARLSAPEAVTRPPHCLREQEPALAAGPHLVRWQEHPAWHPGLPGASMRCGVSR